MSETVESVSKLRTIGCKCSKIVFLDKKNPTYLCTERYGTETNCKVDNKIMNVDVMATTIMKVEMPEHEAVSPFLFYLLNLIALLTYFNYCKMG